MTRPSGDSLPAHGAARMRNQNSCSKSFSAAVVAGRGEGGLARERNDRGPRRRRATGETALNATER